MMQNRNYDQYLRMMDQWLILKQEGKCLDRYLLHCKYHNIAIYGMSVYGRHLIRELQGSAINILYGVDISNINPYHGIPVYRPMVELPRVDAVINTVLWDHASIKKKLSKKVNCPIISLEDVVYGSYDSE